MKYFSIITMIALSILSMGCTASNLSNGAATTDLSNPNLHQANLEIEGMYCPSCALGVEYELKQLQGVYSAEVKYPEGTGAVIYDSSQVSVEEIAAASTVYPASVVEDSLFNG